MTDAMRRGQAALPVAMIGTAMLAIVGCHRATSGAHPATTRTTLTAIAPKTTTRPATAHSPAATSATAWPSDLIEAGVLRREAEQRQPPAGLARILRRARNTQPIRQVRRVAAPLLANATRVVVVHYITVAGGSLDWDVPQTPAQRAISERRDREQPDDDVWPATLILYEDAEGIGYITDFPPTLTAAEAKSHLISVALNGTVSSGYVTFADPTGFMPPPTRPTRIAAARDALREAAESVRGVTLLKTGISLDAAQATAVVVLDRDTVSAAGGIMAAHPTFGRAFDAHDLIRKAIRGDDGAEDADAR